MNDLQENLNKVINIQIKKSTEIQNYVVKLIKEILELDENIVGIYISNKVLVCLSLEDIDSVYELSNTKSKNKIEINNVLCGLMEIDYYMYFLDKSENKKISELMIRIDQYILYHKQLFNINLFNGEWYFAREDKVYFGNPLFYNLY